jgi:hypothetical protein
VKRNGQVKALPIAAHSRAEVMHPIQAHPREGSLYYTDEWQAYAVLRTRGAHVMIRKEKGRPAGRDHINGIEGLASGAMPRTGSTRTAVCPPNTSTCIGPTFAGASTTVTRT